MKKILIILSFFFGLLVFYNPPPVKAIGNTATELTITDFTDNVPSLLFTVQNFQHTKAQEVVFVYIGNSYAAGTTNDYMIITKNRSFVGCENIISDANNDVNEIMHTKDILAA